MVQELIKPKSKMSSKSRSTQRYQDPNCNVRNKNEQHHTPASAANVQFADPFLSSSTLHDLSQIFSSLGGAVPGWDVVCTLGGCVADMGGSIGGAGGGGGGGTGPSIGGGGGGGGGGGCAILNLYCVVLFRRHVTLCLDRVLCGSTPTISTCSSSVQRFQNAFSLLVGMARCFAVKPNFVIA